MKRQNEIFLNIFSIYCKIDKIYFAFSNGFTDERLEKTFLAKADTIQMN